MAKTEVSPNELAFDKDKSAAKELVAKIAKDAAKTKKRFI
jgi:hypothetical protein